jgi:hypothetical protein
VGTTSDTANPVAPASAVWRPYDDPPLLTAEMVRGPHAVPADQLSRLRTYLDALVTARDGPVHVAVAFNAAYFGYDTVERGYLGGPLEVDTFPLVSLGATSRVLPTGAMIAATLYDASDRDYHVTVLSDACADGELALIDAAAVHYGWAEAELAMLTLFGEPPAAFFAAYRDAAGIDDGWRTRAPLYNLYHLLNHLNLFGAGYRGAVREILRRHTAGNVAHPL